MTGWYVASIASGGQQHRSLTRAERLHHDLRLVPPSDSQACRDTEQHRVSIGQQLRTIHYFAFTGRDNEFRRTRVSRDPHDPLGLAKENRVVARPTRPRTQPHRRTDADPGSTVDADAPQVT